MRILPVDQEHEKLINRLVDVQISGISRKRSFKETSMLRWEDLETRTPEEVLTVARTKNRQAISEAVAIALEEKKKQRRDMLESEFKAWLDDASKCLNNGIRFFMIRQALLKGDTATAQKHFKYIEVRDENEAAELAHIQQDYNDKIIEAQARRGDRHRKAKNSQISLTQTQELMLREIVEIAQNKGRYTSLVNHGDARKAAETLEKKGLVQLILSPDKVVPTDSRGRKNDPRPLIENVVPTDAGYKYILDQENV